VTARVVMLGEMDEVDERHRWRSSLMNVDCATPTTARLFQQSNYQSSMTTYADCGLPVAAELAGGSASTCSARLGGYSGYAAAAAAAAAAAGRSAYATSSGDGLHVASSTADRFRLMQHDFWTESANVSSGACRVGTSIVFLLYFVA